MVKSMGKIMVTGGLGFIGSNITNDYLNKTDYEVVVFDNYSRTGVEQNAEWLKSNPNSKRLTIIKGDIAHDFELLKKSMKDCEIVFHIAGQVAVTIAVENPRLDFNTNALGSFNVLEAARQLNTDPIIPHTSTNKVYGPPQESTPVKELEDRYILTDIKGIAEDFPLDPKGLYGPSKQAGDAYFLDYNFVYGMKTITFRMSCIFGPRQMATSDQGWIAWLILCNVLGMELTYYGNGKQVRDILFITDLIEGFKTAIKKINISAGTPFNIGGGPNNAISLLNCTKMIEGFSSKKTKYKLDEWRPGDQYIYVTNIDKLKQKLGWEPKVTAEEGIRKEYDWIVENKELFYYLKK
ncbi:MAG: NAD-dependent epimerase/dehydratase family protein [Candidatus Lokiarchaeota archaeon]|nr:NAD-dependent epimerase/dehydratase family protein [Candidatus Lokiarchaeota archaeon]